MTRWQSYFPRARPPSKKDAERKMAVFHSANNDRLESVETTMPQRVYHTLSKNASTFSEFLRKKILLLMVAHVMKLLRRLRRVKKANAKYPYFGDAVTKSQQNVIEDEMFRGSKNILGYEMHEIPYKVLCSARRGDILWFDLRVDYNGIKREHYVVVMNRVSEPDFGEGFKACTMLENHVRDEYYVAALAPWQVLLR